MFVVLLFIVACAVSSNETNDFKNAKILENEYKKEFPNYYFKYSTSNGISQEETGQMVRSENGEEIFVVNGVYSFIGADNKLYTHRFIAIDKGYREIDQSNSRNRISSSAITSLQGGGLG
ncbi:hypothetical protein FQR65_LT01134 [Abscondita terminalis]|nr:hypothetical protein FQR65_LT01134 [Abscondita terminalis]